MGWRLPMSIIAFFGSVIAVILWLFFYAANFNVYQNIAVVVVIFLAFIAVMGASWASWGTKQKFSWSGPPQLAIVHLNESCHMAPATYNP
jgi:hypothetical protein